jgi:threonine synthase
MRWQRLLAEQEGLYVEPASAASLAAVEQLRRDDRMLPTQTVVSLLTASGLKDPAATAAQQPDLLLVPANFDAAVALLTASKIFPDQSRTAQGPFA